MNVVAQALATAFALACLYGLVGLFVPAKLPFIGTRKRALIAFAVSMVAFTAFNGMYEATLSPEQVKQREAERAAADRAWADSQAASEKAAAERRARSDREAAEQKVVQQREAERQQVARQQEEDAKWIVVDLETLIHEYDENELAADAKYKGKGIQVAGYVDTVAKELLGRPYVTLRSSPGADMQFRRVQCMVAKEYVEAATALHAADPVRLRGTVDGLMGNVHLSRCQIFPGS